MMIFVLVIFMCLVLADGVEIEAYYYQTAQISKPKLSQILICVNIKHILIINLNYTYSTYVYSWFSHRILTQEAGLPLITQLTVRSPGPSVHMSKCP